MSTDYEDLSPFTDDSSFESKTSSSKKVKITQEPSVEHTHHRKPCIKTTPKKRPYVRKSITSDKGNVTTVYNKRGVPDWLMNLMKSEDSIIIVVIPTERK